MKCKQMSLYKSQRKTSACRDETLKIQPKWEWHHNAFIPPPTSCAILLPITKICFVLVSCMQRRVVEGSGWVVVGVYYMLMCIGSELWCGWPHVVATLSMADRVCLACMQKLWSAWAVLDLDGMLELNMADMGSYLCGRLWNEQSWVPCSSMCMNRLCGW